MPTVSSNPASIASSQEEISTYSHMESHHLSSLPRHEEAPALLPNQTHQKMSSTVLLIFLKAGLVHTTSSKNNCEDFAIYCKTGLLVITNVSVGRSGQATAFLAVVSAVVSSPLRYLTTSFGGLTAVGCGMYCVSRLVSDIGVRRDVVKVPVERLVAGSGLDEQEKLVEKEE